MKALYSKAFRSPALACTRSFTLLAVLLGCSGENAAPAEQVGDRNVYPPPQDELEARIQSRAPEEAMLMIPAAEAIRGELAQGQARSFAAPLRSGLCYKVLGQGGPGVVDLDLLVQNPDGVLLQRDSTEDDHPTIGISRAICPATAGLYRVDVVMRRGGGPFVAQVWVSQ